ncbi:MAG: hypothetical protein ACK50L_03480 [Bacteroidota bacterium]
MKPSYTFLIILFIVIVLVEVYFLQALKTISSDYSPNKKNISYGLHTALSFQ